MLVMVALAISLSWKMCLLALVFVGCLMGLLLPLNRKIYRSGQSQLLSYKTVFAMLTEQLSSLKVVKSYVREDFYCQQLNILRERLEAQHVSIARVNALTRWIYCVGAAISFSVFFYVALSWLTVPLPTLLLLLFIFSRLLPQASQLQTHYQQLLHKVPAFADIEQMKGECAAHAEHSIERTSIPPFQDVLELRAVSYQYAGKSEPVFSDMDLRIEKNKTLAIMGPSGAGKSTLADLIAGLVAPTEGGLYCDGLLINDSHRIGWRKNIAYVTQDVYLFNDSLRANLSWVAEEPLSDEDIWQALKLAAADDFVSQLPQQLDTFIGDRGIRLSGGERQRLALARAILSKPKILILDEATSALDHANEQKIQQALAGLKGKLTIIIVAHRETTVAHADDIIHLPFEKPDNPRLAVGLS
jgi:ATP-binding cassette subfamily C protein